MIYHLLNQTEKNFFKFFFPNTIFNGIKREKKTKRYIVLTKNVFLLKKIYEFQKKFVEKKTVNLTICMECERKTCSIV